MSYGEYIPRHLACAATLVPAILWLYTILAYKLQVHYPVIALNGSSLSNPNDQCQQ